MYTRMSLLYPIAVLWVSGILLIARPSVVFSLLGSTLLPQTELANLLGMLFLGLGALVSLVYYYKVTVIYKWTIAIRAVFVALTLGFFLIHQDPFFLSLLAIIVIGVLLTVLGQWKDGKQKVQHS